MVMNYSIKRLGKDKIMFIKQKLPGSFIKSNLDDSIKDMGPNKR